MAKLTKKERAWVDEVNSVLARCPSPEKIGFFTIGAHQFCFMTYVELMR